jgi:hypothetical protein
VEDPCHHGIARPQLADGEDGLQIWSLTANLLYKQSRKTDKGLSSNGGLEVGLRPKTWTDSLDN